MRDRLRVRTPALVLLTALAGCGPPSTPVIANRAEPAAPSSAPLRDRVIAVTGHVLVLKSQATFAEYRDVIASALTIEGVIAATPFTFNELKVSSAKHPEAIPVAVKGVEPAEAVRVLSPYLLQGAARGLDDPKLPSVIVGDVLASTLDVRVGDNLAAELPADPSPASAAVSPPPAKHRFRVAGMFHLGVEDYDRRLAYASLPVLQGVIGRGDSVLGVQIRIKDRDRAEEIARKLEEQLGGIPYSALDWYTLNRALFDAEPPPR